MIESTVVYTREPESEGAGADLGRRVASALGGKAPSAAVVFASPRYDYAVLLRALEETCHPRAIVGASSAGEFTTDTHGSGAACCLAVRADEIVFAAGFGRGFRADPDAAARSIVESFRGVRSYAHPYRTALVVADALAGDPGDLVERLTSLTSGTYRFFGGGAGDDAEFLRTHVFCGTEPMTDAAVALEMLSQKPIGIGVAHGWVPAGPRMRVTEARGTRLVSLNGLPVIEAFEEHARATGQQIDRGDALRFFVRNVLGISDGARYRLRVPIAIHDDGSISCAGQVPVQALVRIMTTTPASSARAGADAARAAMDGLEGERPEVAMMFDCAATRLRLGDLFGLEVDAVADALSGTSILGCNSHGQIAREEGKRGAYHNCTAVVCVLPR